MGGDRYTGMMTSYEGTSYGFGIFINKTWNANSLTPNNNDLFTMPI